MRSTKIVATIGPSSNTQNTIAQLLNAGMDVARLNFSHGTHEQHIQHIAILREAAQRIGQPLTILQDLQGPKIRTGKLSNGESVQLVPGNQFTITTRPVPGDANIVSTTYPALPHDIQPKDRILLADGLIELHAIKTNDTDVVTEVVFGGELGESKGINLPGVHISSPALTEKDIVDLEFGLAHDVDYVAISFVRQAEDVHDLKKRIAAAGKSTPVIAKIEKPEALHDFAAILDVADGIMVARGDLGVEIPAEQVPIVQKQLIEASNAAGVPVITATQMLESMIRNPRPTRAESSDVANAIIDGTDAVMLSGETATGAFPVDAVETMARIALAAEQSGRHSDHETPVFIDVPFQSDIASSISAAACAIVDALPVQAIVAFTMSGNTARLVSRIRPNVPILAFTPSESVYRCLNLVWGVTPILSNYVERLDALGEIVTKTLLSRNLAQIGDIVVMTGGHPISTRGPTNFLKVLHLSEPSGETVE